MLKVELSIKAKRQLQKLIDYLDSNWSETVTNDFLLKLKARVQQIELMPESNPVWSRRDARRCVVTDKLFSSTEFMRNISK